MGKIVKMILVSFIGLFLSDGAFAQNPCLKGIENADSLQYYEQKRIALESKIELLDSILSEYKEKLNFARINRNWSEDRNKELIRALNEVIGTLIQHRRRYQFELTGVRNKITRLSQLIEEPE